MRKRAIALASLLPVAVLLALLTTYAYGKLFSHDRYWFGTIARVQQSQAALIRTMLSEFSIDANLPLEKSRLSRMFAPMDGKLIIEVSHNDKTIYSNFNGRFIRGRGIAVIQLASDVKVALSSYAPPSWNYNFFRWLQNPHRWFEVSFDYLTFPFLWFLAIFLLAIIAVGFAVKSKYLERDVLAVLHEAEQKYLPS